MYLTRNDGARNFQTRRPARGGGVSSGRVFIRPDGLGFVRNGGRYSLVNPEIAQPVVYDEATAEAISAPAIAPTVLNLPRPVILPPPPVSTRYVAPPAPYVSVPPPVIATAGPATVSKSGGNIFGDAWDWFTGLLTPNEEQEIRETVQSFPAVLKQSRDSWALFKVGAQAGLFSSREVERIRDHYREFPKLLETVKPELEKNNRQALREGEDFVKRLGADPLYTAGLGIASLVIAGVLIAGAFGVGGAIWAVGYVKEQNNISRIIDATVAGNLPPEILEAAVRNEGFFGSAGFGIGAALLAVAAVMFGPKLLKAVRG